MPNPLIRTVTLTALIPTASIFGGEAHGARACRADELTRVSDRWEYVEADGYHVGYMTISALVSCRIRAEDMVYTLYLDGKKLTDPADFHPAGMRRRGIVWYLIRDCPDKAKMGGRRDGACIAVKVGGGLINRKDRDATVGKKPAFSFHIVDPSGNSVKLRVESDPSTSPP